MTPPNRRSAPRRPPIERIEASWYEFPHYYDIAMQGETKREADFVEAACRRFCPFRVRRLLEPACGTGRLLVELARRGYPVRGFDSAPASLAYARRRLQRLGLGAHLGTADLAEFPAAPRADAAYNFCNTFRHLLDESAARRHLESLAAALRPGGVYLLGLHVMPPDADLFDRERWTERRGATRVTTTFEVAESHPRRRIEILRVILSVTTPRRRRRIETTFPLRMYTARQLRQLLAAVPMLQLLEVFDFWYDIDHPVALDERSADVVLVLQKRA